jgi:hypothetical protein
MNQENSALTNGAACAALLASAIGAAVMGALTAVSEVIASLRPMLAFYGPAGPLSGRAVLTVVVWLAAWAWLHASWKARQVDFGKIFIWILVLLAGALIGTFPPPFEELGEMLRSMR